MSEPRKHPAPQPPKPQSPCVLDDQHTLVLLKGGQRFIFRCAPGEERALLAQLSDMATDPDSPIQWTDAALICQQLGKRLSQRLTGHLRHDLSQSPGPHA